MHLRSKLLFPFVLTLTLGVALAQAPVPEQPAPAQSPVQGSYDIPTPDGPAPSSVPARTGPANPATGDAGDVGGTRPAPNQPSNTVNVPAQGRAPDAQDNGVYKFIKKVQEVQLHATVVDDRNRLVNNLDQSAFAVFENGQPQQITSFAHRDIPVALGIVIDNSGSMRDKRTAVNDATINLVKASNPNDKVFIVNFNDELWLDQDFTSDVGKLREGLEHIEARGGTALYDALIAAAEHLKGAPLEKKVLLVVTDGEDNTSRESLEQAIRRIQAENGPTVYTIGILGGDSRQKRARRALQEIAEQTGGVSFFPRDLSEVNEISQQIAHDIRNQYFIGYKSSIEGDTGYRQVKVEARARGYGKLQVRTKSGYYAGRESASASK